MLGLMLLSASLPGQSVFINEINYLSGSDSGVEVAGPAGQDMENWHLVTYDLLGLVVTDRQLSGTIPDEADSGYGAIWYDIEQGIIGNGVALVNPSNDVEQFLSYGLGGLIITAVDGLASGEPSTLIDILQNPLFPGTSLELIGVGTTYTDFVWELPAGATQNLINTGQTFLAGVFLPIELTEFKGTKVQGGIAIEWTTASEVNLDHFRLERSRDGIHFETIYERAGRGSETNGSTYTFIDEEPDSPVSYYRLINVDLDGSTGTSETIAVSNPKPGLERYYYAPGIKRLIIEYTDDGVPQQGSLEIYNVLGQQFGQYQLDSSLERQEIDLSTLKIGAYFVKINLGGQVYTRLIINE